MNKEILLSHPPNKSLKEHLKNVATSARNKIETSCLSLNNISQDELKDVAYLTGIAHDIGKANPDWQREIRKEKPNLPSHAPLSAIFGLCLVNKIFNSNDYYNFLTYLSIRQHHSDLTTLNNITQEHYLSKQFERINEPDTFKIVIDIYNDLLKDYNIDVNEVFYIMNEYIGKPDLLPRAIRSFNKKIYRLPENEGIELFLTTNLLFSVLIDSDKKDAAGIGDDICSPYNKIEDKNFVDNYLDYCRKKEPEKFGSEKPLNDVRNSFYKEVVHNPNLNKDNKIYLLTSPTGIGKTFAAYSAALKLKSKVVFANRIIYSLPYTSIIDQNYEEIEKVILYNLGSEYKNNRSKYLLKHHHLSEIEIKSENYESRRYMDDLLLVEAWDSDIIITTFVQLFHSIIGYKNAFLKKFHNIVNSIIILDEMQNIPLEYSGVINSVFKIMAERFNTYFILMTATQPLIFDEKKCINLVQYHKYFDNNLFNRVNLLIDKNCISLEDLFNKLKKSFKNTVKSYLVVCNTKKTAIELYKKLKGDQLFHEYRIYSLTTYLTPFDRKKKLEEIGNSLKRKEKIIVISTQLIEAGVDLSFEVVYRDFAPIDSVVQTAGRCNRNNEFPEKGLVYLNFLVDDNQKKYADYIYPPKLLQNTQEILIEKNYESKDFLQLSQDYFKSCDFERDSRKIRMAIQKLNYDKDREDEIPVNKFRIIYEKGEMCRLFICLDQDAEKTWYDFEHTNEIKDRWKRKDEMEKVKRKMNDYTINLFLHNIIKNREKHLIEEYQDRLYFVRKSDINKIYDTETGYLEEPKISNHTQII